jgi:hypothetical protein
MSAPAISGAVAPLADRPASSLPPLADASLVGDGERKIDAKGDADARYLLTISSQSMNRLDEGPNQAQEQLPEQRQKLANESAFDQIAALRSQVEQLAKRVGNLETDFSAGGVDLSTSGAAKEEAVTAAEVVLSLRSDVTETPGAQLDANVDTNPKLMEMCGLAPSTWEAALFLGRSDVGMGTVVTLWALLILLLNTLLQTTIAVIVVNNMRDPTFFPRLIKELWCASEPRFATACNLLVVIFSTPYGSRYGHTSFDHRSSVRD